MITLYMAQCLLTMYNESMFFYTAWPHRDVMKRQHRHSISVSLDVHFVGQDTITTKVLIWLDERDVLIIIIVYTFHSSTM